MASPGKTNDRLLWLGGIGLVAIVAVVYARVGSFGFVNLDDPEYVNRNRIVLRGLTWDGVVWAFSGFHVANWHPVTWLSHMLDVQILGPSPGGHHLVNVAFHAANTVLLFVLLAGTTGRGGCSLVAAAIFGVHPLRVESVAWIAERKDVLSTFFLLLVLLAWVRFVRSRRSALYVASLALFALGLLSKPMLVSGPLLLLLLDAWPLGRFSPGEDGRPPESPVRLLLEKIPFALLAIGVAAATWLAQSSGGEVVSAMSPIGLAPRIGNAVVSTIRYLTLALWPQGLASFYPHPATTPAGVSWTTVGVSGVAIALATIWVLRERSRRPYLAWGWFWYLASVAPVIGIVQVGGQAMADRYTYIPLIGPTVAVVWGLADTAAAWRIPRLVVGAISSAAIAAFALAASAQTSYWKDGETLHRRAIAVTGHNWKAWHGLCDDLLEARRYPEAQQACDNAISELPTYPEGWQTGGVVRARSGDPAGSIPYFQRALALRPGYFQALQNLGSASGNLGRLDEAVTWFGEALRLRPDDPDTLAYLATAETRLGRTERARVALDRLAAVDPARAAEVRARLAAPSSPPTPGR